MIESRSKIRRAIKITSWLCTWRVKSSEGYEDYAGHYYSKSFEKFINIVFLIVKVFNSYEWWSK